MIILTDFSRINAFSAFFTIIFGHTIRAGEISIVIHSTYSSTPHAFWFTRIVNINIFILIVKTFNKSHIMSTRTKIVIHMTSTKIRFIVIIIIIYITFAVPRNNIFFIFYSEVLFCELADPINYTTLKLFILIRVALNFTDKIFVYDKKTTQFLVIPFTAPNRKRSF